jgi:hypothetical protein
MNSEMRLNSSAALVEERINCRSTAAIKREKGDLHPRNPRHLAEVTSDV